MKWKEIDLDRTENDSDYFLMVCRSVPPSEFFFVFDGMGDGRPFFRIAPVADPGYDQHIGWLLEGILGEVFSVSFNEVSETNFEFVGSKSQGIDMLRKWGLAEEQMDDEDRQRAIDNEEVDPDSFDGEDEGEEFDIDGAAKAEKERRTHFEAVSKVISSMIPKIVQASGLKESDIGGFSDAPKYTIEKTHSGRSLEFTIWTKDFRTINVSPSEEGINMVETLWPGGKTSSILYAKTKESVSFEIGDQQKAIDWVLRKISKYPNGGWGDLGIQDPFS